MRTLAFLLKLPSEDFKHFNDRLAQACQVLRPTGAMLACVDDQPKVTLTAAGAAGGTPIRVAVCPQDARDDGQAAKTEARLGRILEVAGAHAVAASDAEDGRLCLVRWPLSAPAADAARAASAVATPGTARAASSSGSAAAGAALPRRASGRPLFGFRGGPNGQEEHPEEGAIVRTVLECLDAGLRHDQIDSRLMEDHGDWVREHWNPRDRPKLLARIVERADWYRTALLGMAPADDGGTGRSGSSTERNAR